MTYPSWSRALRVLVVLGLMLSGIGSTMRAGERASAVLAEGWRFVKREAAASESSTDWEAVRVPHTYNAVDGQNGKDADPGLPEGYYRGPAWYERALPEVAAWKGRRVFLRFEAAALEARVFVNGKPAGAHRGGFAAFCFEITAQLAFDGSDRVRVRVDNSRQADLAPLSGDFTIFGGLYRPVTVFATDTVCVSPLDHGSSGVYLVQHELTQQEAQVEPFVVVSSTSDAPKETTLRIRIKDASGALVAQRSKVVTVEKGEQRLSAGLLKIKGPHLWSGRSDPYLYSAEISLGGGDKVVQPLGLRTSAFGADGGFLLNGKPYDLHGVNRHQERKDKGWAVSEADHAEDIALITEIGATTLRLAHYQQADAVHTLCDRAGLVVWQEIPLVDTVGKDEGFTASSRAQLEDMILQGFNHPSLCFWSLFNELDAGWAAVPSGPSEPVIRNLQALARELDPSRPTVGASWIREGSVLHTIPDGIGFNIYPGWYWGNPEEFGATVATLSAQLKGRKIAISEYGAGANPYHHQEGAPVKPDQGGPFHPEEWQTLLHQRAWEASQHNPALWGTYVWAMFDFAIDKRNEGGVPGQNDKGLVTRDRKVKKDAFYFYKANWSTEPVLYLASRRATPRHLDTTQVQVFSNAPEVELFVNGETKGIQKPDAVCVFRWKNVTLKPGVNRVEAKAVRGGKTLTDQCEWTLEPAVK